MNHYDNEDYSDQYRSQSQLEQVFSVSLITKGSSYKSKKLELSKLYIALVGAGDHKTEWHKVNCRLEADKVDYINIRDKSVGRIAAIGLWNPDGKIFKSTLFEQEVSGLLS